ncbi:unnamed protein product [Mycena citricolor]|uniref:Uncharacterized protein n=1 Tax=Mycena citricolor TaxID=2018698 RepID=A0AAD2K2R3_9AGAR|nr:unnamed protein product [Mycena citricolor]
MPGSTLALAVHVEHKCARRLRPVQAGTTTRKPPATSRRREFDVEVCSQVWMCERVASGCQGIACIGMDMGVGAQSEDESCGRTCARSVREADNASRSPGTFHSCRIFARRCQT